MSSVLSGSSMTLKNVYVRAIGTTAGIDEFNGPLGDYFDRHYPDFHFGNDSYEQAEPKDTSPKYKDYCLI